MTYKELKYPKNWRNKKFDIGSEGAHGGTQRLLDEIANVMSYVLTIPGSELGGE